MKNLILFLMLVGAGSTLHAQWAWLKEIPGTTPSMNLYGTTTDALGDVYVCGAKTDNSGGNCSGGFQVAKYNQNGVLAYSLTHNITPGNCVDFAYDIAVDAAKNKVFVGGYANYKPALLTLDATTGSLLYQVPITCTGNGDISGLDYAGGYLYMIGNFSGNISIGNGGTTLTGGGVFVAKLDANGNELIVKRIYTTAVNGTVRGFDIKSVVSNGICVSLATNTHLSFQGGGANYIWSGSGTDYVVARLGGYTFNKMWAKKFRNDNFNTNGVYLPLAYHSSYSSNVFCAYGRGNSAHDSQLVRFSLGGAQQYLQNFPDICIHDITRSACGIVYATGNTFGVVQQTQENFVPCWLYPTNFFVSYHNNDCTLNWIEQSSNACAWGEGIATTHGGHPVACLNTGSNPPFDLGAFSVVPVTKAFTTRFNDSLSTCCSSYNIAMDFDGADDYIQSASAPLTGNASFTIEGWFRTNATGSYFRRLIGWGGASTRFEIGIRNNKIALYFYPGGGPYQGTKTVNDNLWHHVAVTRSGNTTTVYIDGVQEMQKTNVGTLNLGTPFRVGRWPGGSAANQNWKGQADEIRVWNTVRTPAEINAKRFCKLAGNETGLVLYYPFEEGIPGGINGNTCNNYATNGPNNGTLYNFAQNGPTSNWVCSNLNVATCTNFIDADDRSETTESTTVLPGVLVYPNPASDRVRIQLEAPLESPVTLRLLDLSGRVLKASQIEPGEDTGLLDVYDLTPSVYLLEITQPDGRREIVKIVKQ